MHLKICSNYTGFLEILKDFIEKRSKDFDETTGA